MLIRYYGHVGGRSGYGEAGTGLCRSILAAGIELDIGRHGAMAGWEGDAAPLAPHFNRWTRTPDLLLIHLQPLAAARELESLRMDSSRFDGVETAVYTTWEGVATPTDPALLAALAKFDHVWSPTPSPKPFTDWIPHAYNADRDHQQPATPSPLYRFYYRGDSSPRKNLRGLLCAYTAAFKAADPVELTLYLRGAYSQELDDATKIAAIGASDLPALRVVHDDFPPDRRNATLRNHDCFVTASHGEAWGLAAFEAVLAGKHVIAPMGLGSDFFLSSASAQLVESRPDLVICDGHRPQGLSCRDAWITVNHAKLALAMQRATTARPAQSLFYDFPERFSYTAVGSHIRKVLQLP